MYTNFKNMSRQNVWLVTGASQGLGFITVKHLLASGQIVIATTRDKHKFDPSVRESPNLDVISLDLTNEEAVKESVARIHEKYGRIDVLVNNAGHGFVGAIEEATARDVYEIFEVNLHATLRMIRYTLPYMRKVRRGHIINLSSISGLVSSPGFGIYNATKYAMEGFTEALHAEVQPLGIHVTLVEPGAFRTNFLADSLHIAESTINDYDATAGNARRYTANSGKQPGNPDRAAEAIYKLVQMETPPLRLLLGEDAYNRALKKLKALETDFESNRDITLSTGFDSEHR